MVTTTYTWLTNVVYDAMGSGNLYTLSTSGGAATSGNAVVNSINYQLTTGQEVSDLTKTPNVVTHTAGDIIDLEENPSDSGLWILPTGSGKGSTGPTIGYNFSLADLVAANATMILEITSGTQPNNTVNAVIGGSSVSVQSVADPALFGGGGGGGGESGGSSGNTANMAANLSLNYVYGDTATQDVQITVFGEEVAPVTADETVVVFVPASALKGLVTFSVGNTGQAAVDAEGNILQYPNIDLVPSAVLNSRKAELKAALKSNPRNGLLPTDGADAKTLSYHLYASTTYTNSILDTSIPAEAIKSQMPQEVMISDLDAVITAISVTGGETASVSTDQEKALVALFETAVYAGRVTKEDAAPHLDLVDGDSITLYVRYDLAQTRRYAADDDVLVHSGASGASTVSLTFGGQTFDITFNNGDDDAKETGTGSKIYAFKFVADSGASVFA